MFLNKLVSRSLRCIHTSTIMQGNVNKQLLSKLRKHTGFAFIKCSNALEKFDNDIVQAEKWLKEEAQKEGWTKATKLQDRPMSQGLVGLVIKDNIASMVEVNCETDFVARNVKFQNLVDVVANALLQHGKDNNISKVTLDQAELAKVTANGTQIGDLAALEIGNLGENILVKRGVLLKSNDDEVFGSYIHSTGIKQAEGLCLMGKFGAVVVCKEDPSLKVASVEKVTPTEKVAPVEEVAPTEEVAPVEEVASTEEVAPVEKVASAEDEANPLPEEEFEDDNVYTMEDLARKLSQHVVGLKPSSIGEFAVKVVPEGKKSKKGKHQNKKPVKDGSLLNQEFMFDEKVTVQDILKVNGVRVTDFVRLECAEFKEMPIEAEPEPVKAEQ